MNARLTIVIPTFNRAHLLARALDSALAQTSDQICVFVSDNASTDGTWDLLQAYSDPRLRITRRANNTTRLGHAQLILPEIDTEFIHTLSDDDYIEPTFSETALSLFEKYRDLSFVYTSFVEHYDDESFLAPMGPEREEALDFFMQYYASKRQIAWCACVIRTADMKQIGLPSTETIFGDMHFWTRIAFKGPIGCVRQRLSHYTAFLTGGDGESKNLPILEWARQSKAVQEDVLKMATLHGADQKYMGLLASRMQSHLVFTTASHFVFARIAGSTRINCLRALPSLGIRGWTIGSAARVLAAFVFTRKELRRLVLQAAKAGARKIKRREARGSKKAAASAANYTKDLRSRLATPDEWNAHH